MRLAIKGLAELRDRLARVRAEEVMAQALSEQAELMAEAVRQGLSEAPGSGEHDRPWLRSGALRDSVGAQTDGLQAAVGSSDPAAVPQEMGTSKMEARPFLAPVAAGRGEEVARAIGAKVAAALKGDDSGVSAADPNVIPASSTLMDSGIAVLGVVGITAFLALRKQSSDSGLYGPAPVPPLMNQSSPDGRKANSSENESADPVKPAFRPNEAHNTRSSRYNLNKDPEPSGL